MLVVPLRVTAGMTVTQAGVHYLPKIKFLPKCGKGEHFSGRRSSIQLANETPLYMQFQQTSLPPLPLVLPRPRPAWRGRESHFPLMSRDAPSR